MSSFYQQLVVFSALSISVCWYTTKPFLTGFHTTVNQDNRFVLQCVLPISRNTIPQVVLTAHLFSIFDEPTYRIALSTECTDQHDLECPAESNWRTEWIKYNHVSSCTYNVSCGADVKTVTLVTSLAENFTQLYRYGYKCTNIEESNMVDDIRTAGMCFGSATVLLLKDKHEIEVVDNTGAQRNVMRKISYFWSDSETFCVWIKVLKSGNMNGINIMSTIANRSYQSIGKMYSISVSLVNQYTAMKIELNAFPEGNRLYTATIPSKTQFDWNLLRTDDDWHLVCFSFYVDEKIRYMELNGYLDGRLVGSNISRIESLHLDLDPFFFLSTYGLGSGNVKYRPTDVEIFSWKSFSRRLEDNEVKELYENFCGASGDLYSPAIDLSLTHWYKTYSNNFIVKRDTSPVSSYIEAKSNESNTYICTAGRMFPVPILLWVVKATIKGDVEVKRNIPGWTVNTNKPIFTTTGSVKSASIKLSVSILAENTLQSRVHRLLHQRRMQCVIDNYANIYGNIDEPPEQAFVFLKLHYGADKLKFYGKSDKNGFTKAIICENDGTNPSPITKIFYQSEQIYAKNGSRLVQTIPAGRGQYICQVTNGNGEYKVEMSLNVSKVRPTENRRRTTNINRPSTQIIQLGEEVDRKLHTALIFIVMNISLLTCISLCYCTAKLLN